MSFKIVSKKCAKLNNIKLKYLSTKVDKYNNEFVYYSIKNKDFDNIINEIKEDVKCPWFSGDIGNFILKVKSSYLEEEKEINGEATINLKHYEYEDKNGYYVNKIELNTGKD